MLAFMLYAMLTCLDPCVYAYIYISICLDPVFTCLRVWILFHMLRSTSLHAYMFRSTCFHAICHVFMLRSIFSLYCCLDLHAYMLDIVFLAMPCLDLHVYMHSSMPICLDLCFHILACLGLLLYMLYAISHVRSICLHASCNVYVFRPKLCLSRHVLL